MVDLFGRDQSVVSRHLRNVFADGELPTESNMQKMHIASADKPTTLYSLDVIISVGYRVKDAALAWLEGLGYAVLHSPDIAPCKPAAERHPVYTRLAYIRNLRTITS